jgi:tetratricopeptide (TPR) repeat protein
MRVILLILVFVFTISAQDHLAEATHFAALGNYEKALQSYRAAQTDAKGPEAAARSHYNIGVCLYQLDRPAEAITELTGAIELKAGKYQRAWYALGMAETTLGNTSKAREAFTKAVELDKKDAEAWFDLGLVLLTEKDYTAARKAFENAVDFGSRNLADAHNNIGVIHALEGNITAAVREFEISGSTEAAGNLKYCRENTGTLAIAGANTANR